MRDFDGAPGFGIGTIRLELSGTSFTFGEAVEGTLLLDLSRAIPSRGLFATLSAHQLFYRQEVPDGKSGLQTETRRIYHYQQQLDGKKEYGKTTKPAVYPFRLMLPPEKEFKQDFGDPIRRADTINGATRIVEGAFPFKPPEWSIEGYLELPFTFDVRLKVGIESGTSEEKGKTTESNFPESPNAEQY